MAVLESLRPKHWVKNILLFLPLAFALRDIPFYTIKEVAVFFIAFCFTASIVYIINDMSDVENDKKHKIKKSRPYASGRISKNELIVVIIVLLIGIIILTGYLKNSIIASLLLCSYFGINLLYTFIIKYIPIIDFVLLSSMYVLRSIAGALVAGVKVTSWFIVTVYFGALILSIGKRLGEMESKSSRSVLKFYTKSYLKTLMIICNVLALVAFSIYLVTLGTMFSPLLIIASFIIFKMIHLVENDPNTLNDPVTFLLKEKSILYSGAIIIIYLSIGLYLEL